jgi:Rad52/22 family double-strand break repair protein
VRITVRAESEIIIREGYGSGDARGALPGEAHELAIKTAETDATKRALATFGKPFGLALYLNGQPSHLSKQPHAPRQPEHHWQTGRPDHERRRTFQQRMPGPLPQGQHNTLPPPQQTKPDGPEQNLNPPAEPNLNPSTEPKVKPTHESVPGRLLIERPRRLRDRGHLKFVAAQPCLLCGRNPSDPHHLRFAQARAQGLKVSDEFTVPLCRTHHRQLHQAGNEAAWWQDMEIDALAIAKGLWEESRSTQPSSASDPQVITAESQTR